MTLSPCISRSGAKNFGQGNQEPRQEWRCKDAILSGIRPGGKYRPSERRKIWTVSVSEPTVQYSGIPKRSQRECFSSRSHLSVPGDKTSTIRSGTPLNVLCGDDGRTPLRDAYQIWLYRLKGNVRKDHVSGGVKDSTERTG